MNATGLPKKLIEFGSWSELIDYARKPHGRREDTGSTDLPGDDLWSGTPNFSAAVNLALNGWTSAEHQAKTLSAALFDKVSSMVEKDYPILDVEGIDIEMGAFMKGEPECWTRFEHVIEDGQGSNIVKIVFNGFFSSGLEHDVIIARGATVAALVELLEYTGTRCEVWHHCPFNATIHFKTLIKSADQPLDLSRLMFAVGHPSMFRRIMFSCLEHNPAEHQYVPAYGSPFTLDKTQQGDVYLDCAAYPDTQWTNPASAQAWVLKELKKLGVTLKED